MTLISKLTEIESILTVDFSKMQSFDMFKNWNLGESRHLKNGIIAVKIRESKDYFQFSTTIPPLVSFEEHWHDCIEVCKIVSGRMGDKLKNKVWKSGESVAYNVGERHIPYNPSSFQNCQLIVDFYKK